MVTGEGRLDQQTERGKLPAAIAPRPPPPPRAAPAAADR
ncbi:hypothetical protein [Nocardia brasiliensis]